MVPLQPAVIRGHAAGTWEVPETALFSFDCPACGQRLAIGRSQRNVPIECPACGVILPGPDFGEHRLDRGAAWASHDYTYEFHCSRCRQVQTVRAAQSVQATDCARCGASFVVPPPPWEHWRRPVARVVTKAERRSSLHLLLSTERAWVPDEDVEPRGRRRFEFYCGGCGKLGVARVWDIASQRSCGHCHALMIVPLPCRPHVTPPPRPRVAATSSVPSNAKSDSPQRGLFCPRCGRPVPAADRWRITAANCGHCGEIF